MHTAKKFNGSLTIKWCFIIMMLVSAAAGWAAIPHTASAHAIAERFTPEPNERLDASPVTVEIGFNEQIEAGLGALEVLDSSSQSVTDNKLTVSEDRRSIALDIPKLGEGIYAVSYRVISADGHPVSGSYVFVIGNPPGGKDASSFNLHEQLGHTGHSASTQVTTGEFILYVTRILYYAAMLLATGLMLWFAMLRSKNDVMLAMFRKMGQWLMRALLIATLLYVFIHSRELMVGQPSEDWMKLFGRTEIGNTWLGLIVLSLLGFAVLKANRLFRGLWAAALLGLESWSGHAAAYDPVIYSVGLNYVHIVASAVWAGGLAFLLVLWFEERKDAGRFAILFSRAAWISIALLTLTGVLSALLFIPSLEYLFHTSWGTLLLIKTGLVLLVIIVGALLRLRVRGGHLPDSMLLKADVTLMALIIAVVGIFTYISPLPANEPVSHHQMGENLHVTLRVSPNVPGSDNRFLVKVWLPDELGKPKSVTLLLKSLDRPELGPIEIPIEAYEDEEVDSFTGFTKATYQTEGPYIPFAGKWQAQIRVMDVKDNELVYERSFRNY